MIFHIILGLAFPELDEAGAPEHGLAAGLAQVHRRRVCQTPGQVQHLQAKPHPGRHIILPSISSGGKALDCRSMEPRFYPE